MCEVTIQFYGVLAEIAGTKKTTFKDIDSVALLKNHVSSTYPKMNNHNYIVAVDNKITNDNLTFNNGCTISLMPPFSGG